VSVSDGSGGASNVISFVTANFVARVTGFRMTGGWGQGDRTTNEYFRPLQTYEARFDELMGAIAAMGFDAVDLWNPHLSYTWATDEHVATARDVLRRRRMRAISMAGGFGDTLDQFERCCEIAAALEMTILGGSTSLLETDRAGMVALLERYDLVLALENHPHLPTPEAMLAAIGDGAGGRIGTAVDTGWYGTTGCDPVEAIERLAPHIMAVHLKDVRAAGEHETCRFGEGIVPVEACVRALQRIGYPGPIAIEDEPEMYDPTPDVEADLRLLRGWMAA
jgi:sugar phosphate isomerase/epimerase